MTQINTDFNKFAFLPDGKRATDLKSLSGLYIGTYIDLTLFHKSSMTQKYPNATELSLLLQKLMSKIRLWRDAPVPPVAGSPLRYDKASEGEAVVRLRRTASPWESSKGG